MNHCKNSIFPLTLTKLKNFRLPLFARHPVERRRACAERGAARKLRKASRGPAARRNDVAGSKGTWIPSSLPGTCCLRCTGGGPGGVTAAYQTWQRACSSRPLAKLSRAQYFDGGAPRSAPRSSRAPYVVAGTSGTEVNGRGNSEARDRRIAEWQSDGIHLAARVRSPIIGRARSPGMRRLGLRPATSSRPGGGFKA